MTSLVSSPPEMLRDSVEREFVSAFLSKAEGRPLRVMHVLDRLDIGGTEKVLMKLIRGLEKEWFEHSICTLRGCTKSSEQWTNGVKILNAGTQKGGFKFNVPRLVRIMRMVRPTIVHSRNWGGIEAVLAGRLARVPVMVHSEHGYELEMFSGLPFRRRLIRHATYRMADAVAAVTEELRNYHATQAWWKPQCINVLHNGVDASEFSPQPQVRDVVRRELGIAADALVIGSVGRVIPLKGFMTLLKAAKMLVSEVPKLRVVLVGSGPELPKLQEYAAGSAELAGRTIFTGTADRVQDMLNCMDIFVLPTLMEGMSNTLLEALAVGLPVVATRVGGNPEVVAEGSCGYLFPPQDASCLAALLRTLLRDSRLRAEFGCASRQRALRDFSLEAMVARYRELYMELAMRQPALVGRQFYVRN